MQYFYINQNSVLPVLRMELINDGRFDYLKRYDFNNAVQNADVTFTMRDSLGRVLISRQPCTIEIADEGMCEERYVIQYKWKKRDTVHKGEFKGTFEITFKDDLYESGKTYNGGNLIMPILEDLIIAVK